MGAVIRGIGAYVPENILTNADLEKLVDTTDEWIVTRTGIRERHILPKDSLLLASDLGAKAALEAIAKAGLTPLDIDGIIVGNITPDKQFPATACFIQHKIGAKNAFAFDLTAACAGFVFGMNMASALIDKGQCKHILIIGAEVLSRVVDWTDRNTCILFGDAAAAVVLSAHEDKNRGVILSSLKSDGSQSEVLYLASLQGNTENKLMPTMHMDGKQVFKLAVSEVSDIVIKTLNQAGYKPADLDFLFLHQANVRILNAIADKLGLPPEKNFINVHKYGNTSSASIPLALYEAETLGKLKPGMLVALAAVGGGMSWGCNLMRW